MAQAIPPAYTETFGMAATAALMLAERLNAI